MEVSSNQNYSLNSWMSHLSEERKNQPINSLMIPGTHDSAAYTLDFKTSLSNSSVLLKIVNFAADKIPFIGKIIKDWTITQNKNIAEQLQMGIRQLDLRVSYSPETETFYLLHSFTCIPLDKALEDISKFLVENPGEVVIINMKSDWPHKDVLSAEIEEKMMELVQNKFGTRLCDKTNSMGFDETTTLAKMVEDDHRIIFSYGKHAVETQDTTVQRKFNWKRENFEMPWPDSSDVNITLNSIKNSLDDETSTDKMKGISFTLTPQPSDVIANVCKQIFSLFLVESENLETLTNKIHDASHEFMNKNSELIKKRGSIITTDFADEKFVRSVIKLND